MIFNDFVVESNGLMIDLSITFFEWFDIDWFLLVQNKFRNDFNSHFIWDNDFNILKNPNKILNIDS